MNRMTDKSAERSAGRDIGRSSDRDTDRYYDRSNGIIINESVGTVALRAEIIPMGEDLLVAVSGGDRPHIGSVSAGAGNDIHVAEYGSDDDAAETEKNVLAGGLEESSIAVNKASGMAASKKTVYSFIYPGHRDDAVSAPLAEHLSALTGKYVAVVCGIHFDVFSEQIRKWTMQAAQRLEESIITMILTDK